MFRSKSSAVLVGFLLILLPVFAVLQYRWIGEVSAAERQRLESSLRVASGQLADEFTRDLGRLSNAFQLREGFPHDGSRVIDRYQEWAETAPYPRLVKGFHLLRTYPDKSPELYKVDLQSSEMQPVPVPDELKNLRDRLRPGAPNFPSMKGMLTIISPILRLDRPFGIPIRPRRFGPPPDVFAAPRPGPPVSLPVEGWTLVELEREVVLKEMMPALVERHFSAHDENAYRVALVTGDPPRFFIPPKAHGPPKTSPHPMYRSIFPEDLPKTADVGGDAAPVRARVDLDLRRTICSASAGFFWSSIGWDLSKGRWSRYASETWPSALEYCSYSERAWSRSSFPASVPEHSGGFRWNSRPACPTSCGRPWL